MKTHTPGPWTVLDGIPSGGGIGIGPDLDGIGPHAIVAFNGGESEANARLIAAAPDLLDVAVLGSAMLGIEARCHRDNGDVGKAEAVEGAIARINQVISIAKAEGES